MLKKKDLFEARTSGYHTYRVSGITVSNWTRPRFDSELLEPVCMGSLHPGWEPNEIIFSNPSNLENDLVSPGGNPAHDRKRLTIRLSSDNGQRWSMARILEAEPAGYSDLAMLDDGTMLCLYECDIVERMCDDRYLRLAQFDKAWLVSKTP